MTTTTLVPPQSSTSCQTQTAPVKETTEVKYCLYARKSSEADERQALSIDSQIKEMMQIAQREGLNITEIRQESHSAKASGQRPEFNRLLEDVRKGLFNGILTWAPDRLSRNAGDLGTLVDLMDQGYLHDIRTYGQQFRNSPNEKFLLMILCSQAKLENDNRGINVKRGLRTKCEMGMRPGCVPLGYEVIRSVNLGGPSKVMVDKERAPYIQKMFDYIINQGYSGRQVHEYLTDEGFRTRNNKKITLSMLYRMFKKPFYYGEFEYPTGSGNWYKGNYEPLITKEQFEQANHLLITYDKSKWGSKEFYFNRIFKCGHCGSGICGEERINRHGKHYTYYSCNKYGGSKVCHSKYIREEKLLESVAKIVDDIKQKYEKVEEKIEREVQKFNDLKRMTSNQTDIKEITAQDYIVYVLKNGTLMDKRQVLSCIEGQLIVQDGEVSVREIPVPKRPEEKKE